ncbi:hypothetical protein V6N11_068540 [Hibiscus sabdariffa]|uniref:Uncharacterized protein n=1 Tax=Hibiscus sabdariffa TaxID=183260 RepID=A0ABR2PA36_9ROSI
MRIPKLVARAMLPAELAVLKTMVGHYATAHNINIMTIVVTELSTPVPSIRHEPSTQARTQLVAYPRWPSRAISLTSSRRAKTSAGRRLSAAD